MDFALILRVEKIEKLHFVTLSEEKGLTIVRGILRFAQNDRLRRQFCNRLESRDI